MQASSSSCFNGAYLDKFDEANGKWVRLVTDDYVTGTEGYSINFPSGSHTLVFPGTLKASPVSYTNLSYNAGTGNYLGGWNLVGNPYTCGLNPNACAVPSGINAFAYVWNGANYTTLSIGSASNPGTIASLQGFFVRTSSVTNSLTLANAAKLHGGSFLKSADAIADMLKLHIEGNNYWDDAFVRFDAQATEGFDQLYDAYKLSGLVEAPQLYSLLPGEKAAVNALPSYVTSSNVSLGLKVGTANTYTINVEGIESFDASVPVRLDDLKLGTSQDLRLNPAYSFTAEPGDAENRFNLSFAEVTGIDKNPAASLRIFSTQRQVNITGNALAKGTVYIYAASGQLIATSPLLPGETRLSMRAPGVYMVKVVTGKTVTTGKVVVN